MSLAIVGMIAEVVYRMARKAQIKHGEGMIKQELYNLHQGFTYTHIPTLLAKNFGRLIF